MDKLNEHLSVEYKKNYKVLTADEGYKLTSWNKEDILDYFSARILCSPLDIDFSIYYTITIEEDERLEAEKEAKLRELDNNVE